MSDEEQVNEEAVETEEVEEARDFHEEIRVRSDDLRKLLLEAGWAGLLIFTPCDQRRESLGGAEYDIGGWVCSNPIMAQGLYHRLGDQVSGDNDPIAQLLSMSQ